MTIIVAFLFHVTKPGFVSGRDVTKKVAAKALIAGKRGKNHGFSTEYGWHSNCVIVFTPRLLGQQ